MIVLEVDMWLEAKRHSHADNKLLEPDRACWYAESEVSIIFEKASPFYGDEGEKHC